jgi:hypothetical protein
MEALQIPFEVATWRTTLRLAAIIGIAVVAVGAILMFERMRLRTITNWVRSWIAIALVLGLLVFCAAAFALGDESTLLSTLVGGVTASVGAAVAFYFSSDTSDRARQDILEATFKTEAVPNLMDLSREEAVSRLAQQSLKAELLGDVKDNDAKVDMQMPLTNSQIRPGSVVAVHLTTRPKTPGP